MATPEDIAALDSLVETIRFARAVSVAMPINAELDRKASRALAAHIRAQPSRKLNRR